MGQFNLPKSNKMMPPKKGNAVLDVQSDAAVGMPSKGKVGAKKFDNDRLPKSNKTMKMKEC